MSSHHRNTPLIITLALLFLASLAAVSCTLRQDSDQYSVVNIDELGRKWEIFQQWKEEHNKVYTNTDEEKKRFEDFKGNLEYVMERTRKLQYHSDDTAHRVGLNKFADLSNEEFRSRYLSRKFSNRRRTVRHGGEEVVQSCDAPSSLDWRKYGIVTAVKDQGSCGSCWAFSSTGAIEGINALVTGELVSLSEQELVDCDRSNDGCDGGNMDYAFEWVINNGGIDTETDYPYIDRDGTCNTTKEKTKEVSINWYVDVAESDSALLCAVVQQPISVGLDGSAIDFQLYTGGIYHGSCSDNPNDIDHAALIIGYGTKGNEKYWIVKNSWGTSWGIDGYFYLKRDTSLQYGTCGVNAMASYPTKESSPSSPPPYQPPSPPPPPTPPSPPPPPSPSDCGDFFSFCSSDETCCCLFEFFDLCLIYGCCEYENGVCCAGSEYCCPSDYPICDVQQGLCLKNGEDYLGVTAKKRKLAKHKLPWSRKEQKQTMEKYHTLQWKRNPLEAMQQ